MRMLSLAFAAVMLCACEQASQVEPSTLAAGEECYLNVSYVSGNELSQRVWQHIQTQQYDLIESGGTALVLLNGIAQVMGAPDSSTI